MIGLLLVECVIRVGFKVYLSFTEYKNAMTLYPIQPDPFLGWIWNPSYNNVIYYTNKHHTENSIRDTGTSLKKNKPKIIFLGDSWTIAQSLDKSVKLISPLDKLTENYDVINLSVPYYSSYQGYRAFEAIGTSLKPDIVIVMLGFEDRRFYTQIYRKDNSLAFLRHYYRHFFEILKLYEASYYGTEAPMYNIENLTERVDVNEYLNNLLKIINLTKRNKAKLIFMEQFDNPRNVRELYTGLKYITEQKETLAILALEKAIANKNIISDFAKKKLSEVYLKMGNIKKSKQLLASKSSYVEGKRFGGQINISKNYNLVLNKLAMDNNIPVIRLSEIMIEETYFQENKNLLSSKGNEVLSTHLASEVKKLLPK